VSWMMGVSVRDWIERWGRAGAGAEAGGWR
jgi:hypothetical protein